MRSGFVYTRLILPTLYLPMYIGCVCFLIAAPVIAVWNMIDLWREGFPLQPLLPFLVFPAAIPLFEVVVYYVGWLIARRKTVTIDNEGILFQYFLYHNRKPWESVDSVEEDGGYFYISSRPPHLPFLSAKISRRQALSVMIPKHAFPSSKEAEAFYSQAMDYCREAVDDQAAQVANSWPPAPTARP